MENEDYSFFNPREDFPVVGGDNGRDWISESQRIQRTPAADVIMAEERSARALKSELRELESLQSDEDLEFYDKHKDRFSSASEKIYFLNLPPEERKDYLVDRGFLSSQSAKYRSHILNQGAKVSTLYSGDNDYSAEYSDPFVLRRNDVMLGMNKGDVLESIGKPVRVEIAGNPRNENERWLYETNGASRYIYFESGEVHGWE